MVKYVQSNGIQLAYEEEGSGTHTLIVMHGLTANLRSFDGLMRAGLADNYRVIRVDLRGRGLSDKPAQGYSMADHAADIIGLMDALHIKRATLVGHSFGGLLSIYMAANLPECIEKIVIIDAGKEATHPDTLPKIKPSLDRLGKPIASWDIFIHTMKNSPYYIDGFWDSDLEAMYRADVETLEDGSVRSRVYPAGIEEAVKFIIGDDWEKHLRAVQRPALLIHAPASFGTAGAPPILSDAGAAETIALLPDCQYVKVGGHHITMLFGEHAAQIVTAIQEFIR
jgi:pimeloyl-ACP methyl ester carboxylesterase